MRYGIRVLIFTASLTAFVWAQTPAQSPEPNSDQQAKPGEQHSGSGSNRLPHSEDSTDNVGESSSRSTKIDLAAPAGEASAVGVGDVEDVHEMKPWNPHKADKNVEVGDYYFKQKNYRAAESRYLEALYWQDNNAIANFRLGQTEERLGKPAVALKYYESYLKVLPDGRFASEARQGIDRLKAKESAAAKQH